MKVIAILIIIFIQINFAHADCVYGAKSKTRFQALDSSTILLTGGYGGTIIAKIYCCVYSSSNVTVLKDDFCSFDDSVFYIDGEIKEVRDVKKIN